MNARQLLSDHIVLGIIIILTNTQSEELTTIVYLH